MSHQDWKDREAAESAAKRIEVVELKLYRPSNGTEGAGFFCDWCDYCERDKDEDCPILADSLAFDVDHPRYPREWVYGKDGPECTAYVELGKPVPPPKDEYTLDLPL